MGRKAILVGDRKPAQKTVKLNEVIYPFVMELKGNLKMGLIDGQMMDDLFAVLKRSPANNDDSIKRLPIKTSDNIKKLPVKDKPEKTTSKAKVKAEITTSCNAGTVVEVLASLLPEGINNTNNMRSALSDGYRKAYGINESLKAKDAQGLSEYLQSLSADEISQLIQIKKETIREKAKAKKLAAIEKS